MILANLQPLANHLWQSTLFAVPVALLALALRKNRAAVRYWLWLAASVKFLIPFSLLVDAGRRLEWRSHPAISQPQFSYAVDQIARPFAMLALAPVKTAAPSAPVEFSTILLCLWFCGFAFAAFCWLRSWRLIHAAKRSASPLYLKLPIPAFSTPSQMEPGVFGIRKPVLLLPEGIMDRLTPAQLEAVFAHEFCHVRRRDNLTAAIHTVVETIFWFHPLVWWIRARLVEEREHACDEEVLGKVGDAQDYAEGILNVCKLYLESPLRCVSGVMGSNLKKRVHSIIYARTPLELNFRRKILLGVAGFAVVAGPVAVGIANAPPSLAQSTAGAQTAQPSPSAAGASKASSSLIVGSAKAQTNASPTFEVASVKPTREGVYLAGIEISGSRVSASGPVIHLISVAYELRSNQIVGAPKWANDDVYLIDGRAPENSTPTTPQARLMLRALLADRFRLAAHNEVREAPVYALVVARGGPRIKESPADAKFDLQLKMGPVRRLAMSAASIESLCRQLAFTIADRPVVDKTGLRGRYDISLEWAADDAAADDVAGVPSLFTAVQERLGLRLEATKVLTSFLVIDHLERPSPN